MIRIYVKSIEQWKSPDVYRSSLELLSPERRARVEACVHREDSERRLGASALLQEALEAWTGHPEPPFRFGYRSQDTLGDRGKPYLIGYEGIHCNLSHSGEYVACAIGDVPMGIDIQEHSGVREKILSRYYCEDERSYVNQQAEEDRMAAFYRIWCRKEAYIKYTGLGLGQGMASFSTLAGQDVLYGEKKLEGYSIAVCYAADTPDNHIEWNMERKEDGI